MSYVDSWDAPYATWDSGLQWDVNVGPNLGDVQPYLDLVTSEHQPRARFMATVRILVQPPADNAGLLKIFPGKFDLDFAIGQQLDVVGQWVGRSRQLSVPLDGVYFSWGIAGVGWGQGTWKGPFDPVSGLVALPDDAYRSLLRATIAANHWDGTIPGAYAVWDVIFAGTGHGILIQDLQDMHMIFALTGTPPDAVTLALFTGGYLVLKPAGVQVIYVTPSDYTKPYFGWGVENDAIAGWGHGAWAQRAA